MNAAQNSASVGLAAINALYNTGFLDVFSGTQPVTPETALSGNTLLVSGLFAASAFAAPAFSSGFQRSAATFSAASYAPVASGTASFARAYKADHTTVIADYTVGTTGTDIIAGSTSIATGVNVSFAMTNTMPAV